MVRSFDAVYDGEVLRPVEPLDLPPNTRVRVAVVETQDGEAESGSGPFDRILALAQDLGVPDLAEQHDHYLYGTPKR